MDIKKIASEKYPKIFGEGVSMSNAIAQVQREAFISGYNHNRWVSVEELPKLPEPYYDEDLEGMVSTVTMQVILFDGENVFCGSFNGEKFSDEDATHYMILPTPPNQ